MIIAVAALSLGTFGVARAGYDSTPAPIPGEEDIGVWSRIEGRMQEMHQAKMNGAIKPSKPTSTSSSGTDPAAIK